MSRDSDYFKKVQMNLFDFFNQKPLEKFKGKDLLGPIKYLTEDQPAENSPAKYQPVEDLSVQNPPAENPSKELHHRLQKNSSLAPQNVSAPKDLPLIFGLPVIVNRKPYMRHLRFSVKPNGTIGVIAPLNRHLDLILKELHEHEEWILKSNSRFQKLRDLYPVKKFKTGESFPLFGEMFSLKLTAVDFKKPLIQLDLDQIQFYYPEKWDNLLKTEKNSVLKKHFTEFYYTQAVTILNQRVRALSEQTKLYPKKINFRNQKTRWGSCSSGSTITLNWKLVAYDQSLIDYVIIHELCHLEHPNHSRRFWALVEQHCANYKQLNQSLNQNQFLADFLSPHSELYLSNPSLE